MKDEMFEFRKNSLQGALTSPLCREYSSEWFADLNDKYKLVALSLRQQSCPFFAHYCYMGKGLSKEYILKEFGEYVNGYTIFDADIVKGFTYGLYVDYDYDNGLLVDHDVVHIMWTKNEVFIPTSKCPTIYVSNKSEISLVGNGYNNIRVYLFDESKIIIDDIDEESNVTIYKYSDLCVVEKGKFCFGKINEFKKELRL